MQHREQSLLPGGKLREARGLSTLQHVPKELQPLEIVEVEHATDCPPQLLIVGARGPFVEASQPPQRCPAAAAAAVDIFDLHPRLKQKGSQRDIADLTEFGD